MGDNYNLAMMTYEFCVVFFQHRFDCVLALLRIRKGAPFDEK